MGKYWRRYGEELGSVGKYWGRCAKSVGKFWGVWKSVEGDVGKCWGCGEVMEGCRKVLGKVWGSVGGYGEVMRRVFVSVENVRGV